VCNFLHWERTLWRSLLSNVQTVLIEIYEHRHVNQTPSSLERRNRLSPRINDEEEHAYPFHLQRDEFLALDVPTPSPKHPLRRSLISQTGNVFPPDLLTYLSLCYSETRSFIRLTLERHTTIFSRVQN
jgi:hypothetical protein